jgi:hypothetical protein
VEVLATDKAMLPRRVVLWMAVFLAALWFVCHGKAGHRNGPSIADPAAELLRPGLHPIEELHLDELANQGGGSASSLR